MFNVENGNWFRENANSAEGGGPMALMVSGVTKLRPGNLNFHPALKSLDWGCCEYRNGIELKMSTKEAFEQKIEAQLKQMSIEIQNLLNWADEVEFDVGGETKRAIDEICDRWTDVEREWNRIRTAGEEGWEHLQYRIEVALRALRLAIEPAMARFRQLSPTNAVSLASSS